jgi:predicted nucleic acid-binding protein
VFSESEDDTIKREKAMNFLEELRNKSYIVVSVQVLNEFHSALKRKYKIDEEKIREYVSKGILNICKVVSSLDLQTYKAAYKVRDQYNISYWDSVIVASALDNECEILYSEDMADNLKIENKLLIRNPLTGAIPNEEFPQ